MIEPHAIPFLLTSAFPRAPFAEANERAFEADYEHRCASCGAFVFDDIDYEYEVAFCNECNARDYDEDYCDLGGEG